MDKVSDPSQVMLAEKLEVNLFEASLLPDGRGCQLVQHLHLLCLNGQREREREREREILSMCE